MPDHPKSFDTIIWEEKDMWQDAITLLAEFVPSAETPNVFDLLMSKHSIKENHGQHG